MNNNLLTSYLNISKLLELTPNTNEYNCHRTVMSKEEIQVVKHIKKKRAMDKHRALKKLSMHKVGNKYETSISSQNGGTTNSEHECEISDGELSNSLEVQPAENATTDEPKTEATSRHEHATIFEGKLADDNAINDDSLNGAISKDEHVNEISSKQITDSSNIEETSSDEIETENGSTTSEPQAFQMYDDEDETDNEVYEALYDESDEILEEYHQKMDEATFNKFKKLYSKLLRLVKNSKYDVDEFEMLRSQIRNMMSEADEDEPTNETLDTFVQTTVDTIDSYRHKDEILEQIEELKALTKTPEDVETMEKWMPLFKNIVRLTQIPQNSKAKKKKKKRSNKR
jgi:hypothetical protein